MELPDKLKLALGIFWNLMTIYFLVSLLPGVWKWHEAWQARIKRGGVKPHSPTRLQRVIISCLTGVMSAELVVEGLHHNFYKLTGISPGMVLFLMMFMPGLYFLTGAIQKWFQKKPEPES